MTLVNLFWRHRTIHRCTYTVFIMYAFDIELLDFLVDGTTVRYFLEYGRSNIGYR